MPGRSRLVAGLLDALALLAFAAAGRRSHDEGGGAAQVVETAAPFLLGAALAWLATGAFRRPLAVGSGVRIWALGTPLGLALRSLVFDRGIAPSFVVVALVATGALLVGWRALAALVARRRAPRTS